MKHPDTPDYVVGVVGCGAMGQGIAQVSAQGGIPVLLFDARDGGAEAAKDQIAKRIERLVEKGRLGEDDAKAAISRLTPVAALDGLAPADTVVEAVFEDLDVKQGLFRDLEAVVRPDCILASNTSSIPISSIARVCEHRDRVAGLHFFNPVPLMKLVEVIRPIGVADQVISHLMALGKRMTRVPVEVKDSPGFLVNMGGRAYTTEALRIVHEGVATPAQVDAIMRDCWGFRMGPFELMDLTGIDVNYPVSQIIYEGYNQDPRLKTSPNHKAMYDAGLFGRKTGQGWYRYDDKGQMIDPPSPDFETDADPVASVTIFPHPSFVEKLSETKFPEDMNPDDLPDDEMDLAEIVREADDLMALCKELGLKVVKDDGKVPVLVAPRGHDATSLIEGLRDISLLRKTTAQRVVCIDPCGDHSRRVTLMTAPGADSRYRQAVAAAISSGGRNVTMISDSPGFVGQRLAAMVANLGCYMAEIGLASPEDIDTAMQLGLNYPRGSIALGEFIGAADTALILQRMQEVTGEDRYRPTLWLKRRAMLGLSLYTPN